MHTLFVLRHAKSSWNDPALDDHDRPLAPRGRRATELMRKHLDRVGIRPSLVLCSSARRARETLDGVAPSGQHVIDGELYGASAGSLVERLKRVPEEADAVMVIGHNPAIQDLVLGLAGEAPAVQHKFPTGALATLKLSCRWVELGPGRAEFAGLVRPKDLHQG
jgi:phosphohistidine phosphatase